MRYEDEGEQEVHQERGVTKHTVDRDWSKHEGIRFHCSSCGKKNVEHYLRLGNCQNGKYKTAESRKEYAKKNNGTFCYLEGKSKTCEPCLQLKRENTKKFGRKTKARLADERDTLRAIIARLDPNYQPLNKAEANALGIKWKEEKEEKKEIKKEPKEEPVEIKKEPEEEAQPAPAPPSPKPKHKVPIYKIYKSREEAVKAQQAMNKKSKGKKKLLIMDEEIEN
jgi:hypothetical protein